MAQSRQARQSPPDAPAAPDAPTGLAALTPLALQNAALLRALAAGEHTQSIAALAAHLDRDPSNVARSLKALAQAGLIATINLGWHEMFTPAGVAALAALDAADATPGPAPSSPFALIPHHLIAPDPLNPRKHFDTGELDELAASIAHDGLLENLVIRPMAPGDTVHRLVAGERRWRAIGLLIAAGTWDAPIPCKVIDIDDAAHRRIALVENLQRKDLRPIDEAQALKDLMAVARLSTAEVARDIGFTQRFVQQRLQLLDLPAITQGRINTGAVSIEQGRAIASLIPQLPEDMAGQLAMGTITVERARQWLATRPALDETLTPRQWLILLEIAHAAITRDGGPAAMYHDVPCHGPDALADPDLAALLDHTGHLVRGPRAQFDQGFEVGHGIHIPSWGEAWEQLTLKFPGYRDDPEVFELALVSARAAAGEVWPLAMLPGEYATPWLRGPFDPPPEIAAQIAQARADRAAAVARDKADSEAGAQARRLAARRALALSQDLIEASPTPTALAPRITEAAAASGWALPLRPQADGEVADANGVTVWAADWGTPPDQALAQANLIAFALNAAAGLPTATAMAADDDDADFDPDADADTDADDDSEDA